MPREMKPFVILGHGQTDENIKEFGPAGSMEKHEAAEARKKLADEDPKDVKPAELKTPPRTAKNAAGSDLAPTAGG